MICGQEVGLRPFLESDLDCVAQWRNDPATRAMFYSPFLLSETALRNWNRALLSDSARLRFIVQRLADDKPIGIVGLEHIQYRNQEAELAGLIMDPAETGQGLGSKSIALLTRYAFEDLNLHRLFARIYASNVAARRVAEKAGLKHEGTARQAVFHDWHFEDVIYMSILREERQDGTAPTGG